MSEGHNLLEDVFNKLREKADYDDEKLLVIEVAEAEVICIEAMLAARDATLAALKAEWDHRPEPGGEPTYAWCDYCESKAETALRQRIEALREAR